MLHRSQQHALERVECSLCVAGVLLVSVLWKLHLPVRLLTHRFSLDVLEVETQIVAWLQRTNVLEACGRSGDGEEVKNLIDAAKIGPEAQQLGRDHSSALGLQQQQLTVAISLTAPIKRHDPESIARQNQT